MLLVEPDTDDADILREVFEDAALPIRLEVVQDQDGCRSFLAQEGMFRGAPRPEVILLAVDVHGMESRHFLEWLKNEERYRDIPVIVLGDSDDPDHVHDCYAHSAAAYLRKPMDLAGYRALAYAIRRFWFDTAFVCRHG